MYFCLMIVVTGAAGFIGSCLVSKLNSLGFKNLSYPIKDKKTGFFHLFQYTSDKIGVVKNLETEFIRDDSIMRYITVSLCKDGIEFNARRAKGEFNKKTK